MVSSVSNRWNSLYPSLLLMHEKLESLGLVYANGEITYLEPEDSNV